MRMDVADLDLNDTAYCVGKRYRTIGSIIGLFDTAFLTVAFLKAIQLLREYGFNLFATSSVSCVGALYVLHMFCIVASLYGFARQKSAFIVPKIVLKVTTVILCLIITGILVYFIITSSEMIGNIIAKGFNIDFYEHKATINMGVLVLAAISAAFSIAQIWLLILLWYCFKDVRNSEIRKMLNVAFKDDKARNAYTTFIHSESLSKESVTLDQINAVVITHGHPGFMGNMNFFAQKPILFHSLEYIGRHVTPTELRDRPYRKLSQNIEVWKTPGHTQHDLTVLIHNVAGYGTMAVVGDLIPSEALISEKKDFMADDGVWDAAIKRQNANLIICMADWIVPGHGQPFRVLAHYRQKAGCTRLLAQRHMLNQAF